MKTITALHHLRVGDTVAILNLLGRRLARVSQVCRAGFSVGRKQYHWDGRGRNHSESVAAVPLAEEFESLRPAQAPLKAAHFGQRLAATLARPRQANELFERPAAC